MPANLCAERVKLAMNFAIRIFSRNEFEKILENLIKIVDKILWMW